MRLMIPNVLIENERLKKMESIYRGIADETLGKQAEIDRLRAALQSIADWAKAYPLEAFPEPDMARARRLLATGGMTLDAISASNMRHVVAEVAKIARDALESGEEA